MTECDALEFPNVIIMRVFFRGLIAFMTTESFEITIRCHAGLYSGSGSKNEQPGRVAPELATAGDWLLRCLDLEGEL